MTKRRKAAFQLLADYKTMIMEDTANLEVTDRLAAAARRDVRRSALSSAAAAALLGALASQRAHFDGRRAALESYCQDLLVRIGESR